MPSNHLVTGWTPLLERAIRTAAILHRHQQRKATAIPYLTHPVAVAWILREHGWSDETTLAAALLHDVLEDTAGTVESLLAEFPAEVVRLVQLLSERKTDTDGHPLSWEDRKRDHLVTLRMAPISARAIALADKLHNLETIQFDLQLGVDVWSRFNAPRDRIIWYHTAMVECCEQREALLSSLAGAVRHSIQTLERAS